MKHAVTELKREFNCSTIRVGDFNTQNLTVFKITRQKINKETDDLNNTVNQLNPPSAQSNKNIGNIVQVGPYAWP